MIWRSFGRLCIGAIAFVAVASSASASPQLCLRGVNVAGAEFGDLPGRYGFDYAYPAANTIATLARSGITAIRLPFRWERLQPNLNRPLDAAELARLDATVDSARAAGLTTILDLHNYAYYNKARVGSTEVPVAAFADLWARLAGHFRSKPQVAFGLMNEPYDMPAPAWLEAANAAIAAIRAAKAKQLILVPGTAYSGAHSWTADLPVGNNGITMLGVRDPSNNYAFEFHQYLDDDYSGRSPACDNDTAALTAIGNVTAWLKANKRRGFIGEIGASDRPKCVAALANILDHLNDNSGQWVGWTIWAAGDRWPATYPFNLQPAQPTPPVLAMLSGKTAGPHCKARAR